MQPVRPTLRRLGVVALVLVALNEVRGIIMAGPVLVTLFATGNTVTQVIVALCTLGGIAASVLVPALVARRLRRRGQ